jgi:O-antigen ligase
MMAGLLLAMASFVQKHRMPAVLHFVVVAIISISASALFLNVGGGALETMGRDPTLTGRTEIWRELLGVVSNPLIGTGFESFWLGDHLRKIWAMGGLLEGINEAHNGYLEVYLNLGWIGVALLGVLIVTGYRNVVASFRRNTDTAKLRLAFFVAAVVYCLTEAAFKMMCPIWIAFLLAITAIPDSVMPEGPPQFDSWEGNIFADSAQKADLGLYVGLRQELV